MKPGVRIALAVAVAVAVFGGRALLKHDAPADAHHDDATPAAASSAALARPVKSKPRSWQVGDVLLHDCDLGRPGSGATEAAWCAKFDVPENRDDPGGRHIKLKLALVRSDAEVADDDMVVLLAGGPGEAATESFVSLAPAFEALLKHHHVLLLDQRGTGGSNPLSCHNAAKKPAQQEPVALDLDELRKDVRQCLDEVGRKADPRFYTTTVAVEDLEAVRKALGSPTFDLIGVSYGTRMAQQYLRRHPEGVRSVVLDSVVPNQLILGEDFAVNLEQALKKDFDRCTSTPACAKRFGDPMQSLYQLRDALRANPHKVSFRDPQTYGSVERTLSEYSLAAVVRMFAYAPETAALLPLSIDAAAHGDVGPLLGQAKLLHGDLDGDMNNGMQMSVACAEDVGLLHERPQDENTILGNRLVQVLKAECDVWPHGSMPADFHQPVHSDKPVLLLSGDIDPVTPPRYGKQILPGLSHGRQLVFKGQGHAVLVRGCMPKLLGTFIDKPDPAALDASCLDALRPMPAFIDFNGAAP